MNPIKQSPTEQSRNIPEGWVGTTIGTLVDLAQGVAINAKTDYVLCDKEHGIPLLKINNLLNNTVDQYANPDLVPKQSIIHNNDIIFTRTGQVGAVFFNKYGILHNNSFKVIPKDEVYWKYLYWYLKSEKVYNYVQKVAAGSVQKDLNHSAFKTIEFKFPKNIEEQKSIAAILTALDDKIELLQAQNQTLEQTAQTIFKEWFGKYQIGDELPEGWRFGKLGDEFEILMGQSPNGESYNTEGKGMVFFQGRAEFSERFPKNRLYTTEPKRVAEKFDVLVCVRAPVGDINVASETCCIGRGLAAVKSKNKSYALYKLMYLKPEFDLFEGEGTVFGSINKESFNNIEVIIPSDSKVNDFENCISKLDYKIFLNHQQIQTLTQTRDALLPKLMSGEVRVNEF